MAKTTLYVCTTCQGQTPAQPDAPRPGAMLHQALKDKIAATSVKEFEIIGVECLSACKTGCAIALSAPSKWTYVYGHINDDTSLDDIITGAQNYAASADGIVPWRERPALFRKNSIARIPPTGETP